MALPAGPKVTPKSDQARETYRAEGRKIERAKWRGRTKCWFDPCPGSRCILYPCPKISRICWAWALQQRAMKQETWRQRRTLRHHLLRKQCKYPSGRTGCMCASRRSDGHRSCACCCRMHLKTMTRLLHLPHWTGKTAADSWALEACGRTKLQRRGSCIIDKFGRLAWRVAVGCCATIRRDIRATQPMNNNCQLSQ